MCIFIIQLFSLIVFAGCESNSEKNPPRHQNPSSLGGQMRIPEVKEWHKDVVLYQSQPKLCTKFVFSFLTNFISANQIGLPGVADAQEVVDFMRLSGVVPVFKPTDHHESRLAIDRFERCEQSNNALEAIQEEALGRVSLEALPMGNLTLNFEGTRRRKPTSEDWRAMRNQIIQLRKGATPTSVSILRRKLSDYLGVINSDDEVIAVYTQEDYIPLSTVLRLQGRLVGFIGVTGPNDSMEQIECDYVLDSITESEYKILADERYHITAHDLEVQIHGKGILPSLVNSLDFESHRQNLEEIVSDISNENRRRFRMKKRMGERFSSHDAVSLEMIADLNPNAKFILLRGPNATFGMDEAMARGVGLARDVGFEQGVFSADYFFASVKHLKEVFKEMVSWLTDRNVRLVLKSSSDFAGVEKLVDQIWDAGNRSDTYDQDMHSSLIVNEGHLSWDSRAKDRKIAGHLLASLINLSIESPILKESLAEKEIVLVQSLGNPSNYGFSLRRKEKGWKGDSRKDAEVMLALQHLSLESHLRNRYPKNVIKVGASRFSLNTQIRLFERSERAEEELKEKVRKLDWEEMFNWSVAHLVIDQGDNFSNFKSKKLADFDFSYESYYRLLEIHDSFWLRDRNVQLRESFKGVLFENFHYDYVPHGTTSFAVPLVGALVSRLGLIDFGNIPNGYVRPFRTF